jgi:hypothetical protein
MYLEKAKIDAETNRMKSSGLTKKCYSNNIIETIKKNKVITDGKTPIMISQ